MGYPCLISPRYINEGDERLISAGHNGKKITTTSYTLDTATGIVTAHVDVKTTDPVDAVLAVGTKKLAPADKVTEKKVEHKTVYTADETMEAGTKRLARAGIDGTDTITTSYNVDGSVKDITVVHTKAAVDTVIAVGTKTTVQTEEVPYQTVQKSDDTMEKGTTKVLTNGVNGTKTTTTSYTLNTETGEVTASTSVKTVDPVNEVIAVGTREANPYTAEKIAQLKPKLLDLINEYRTEVGASPLVIDHTYDSILDARAAQKAKDKGTTGTYSHSGYDDLPDAITTVTDEDLKAHNAKDGWAHGGESLGVAWYDLYASNEDQFDGVLNYEKMTEDDEKDDYQAIVIDKTRTSYNGPSQTYRHYTMMIDKKISKVYIGVGSYVAENGDAWLSVVFEFRL